MRESTSQTFFANGGSGILNPMDSALSKRLESSFFFVLMCPVPVAVSPCPRSPFQPHDENQSQRGQTLPARKKPPRGRLIPHRINLLLHGLIHPARRKQIQPRLFSSIYLEFPFLSPA